MDLNASKNLTNQRSRAAEYIKKGWPPIPVKSMGEEPLHPDWQNLRIGMNDIDRWFPDEPTNIGVLLGKASGGLVDVHIVDKDARRFARYFLPATGMRFGPASARSSHWLYEFPDGVCFDLHTWSAAGIGTIVQVRGNGQMTLFPDSIDESGELITFEESCGPWPRKMSLPSEEDGAPWDFDYEYLRDETTSIETYLTNCLIQIPLATVLYKRARNSEDPSSLLQSMTKLLLGCGWPDTAIKRLIRVVECEAGTSGQEKACRAVYKETCRAGRSGLADCLGEEAVRDIENWDFLHFGKWPSLHF